MNGKKAYIGARIFFAEPMYKYVGSSVEEGYKIIYPNNYITWCPKEIFETYYRVITESEKQSLSSPDNFLEN